LVILGLLWQNGYQEGPSEDTNRATRFGMTQFYDQSWSNEGIWVEKMD